MSRQSRVSFTLTIPSPVSDSVVSAPAISTSEQIIDADWVNEKLEWYLGGRESMVTIQSRVIRKKYKRSSPPYVYHQLLLPLPASCNKILEPFLKKKLCFAMDVKDGLITIRLTEQANRA